MVMRKGLLRHYGVVVLTIVPLALACGRTSFRSGGKSTDPSATPSPVPEQCNDEATSIGVNVAFVIDNSSSNENTDCPSKRFLGYQNGIASYQCAETNRERAVLAGYDQLASLSGDEESAASQFSVISFPSANNIYSGAQLHTEQWAQIARGDRASLAASLAFTRKPMGMTPMLAGLELAEKQFQAVGKSDRKNVVVVYADGESTDQNPDAVKAAAKRLVDQHGATIVSVLVTDGVSWQQRVSEHERWLRNNGQYSQDAINKILGLNGQKPLIQEMSTHYLEVSKSDQLEDVFRNLIIQQTSCN